MKLVRYKTFPEPSLVIEDYRGKPYVKYEECSNGLYLEVTVDDNMVEDIEEALKGDLPDAVLALLGISVTAETLEEICAALKERGLRCSFSVKEDEKEYCERIEVELGAPTGKLVKVVIEDNNIRVQPARDRSYVKYRSAPKKKRLEATIPASMLEILKESDDKIRSVVAAIVPPLKEANLDDPSDVLKRLEESGEDYRMCVERHGDVLEWTLQ